MAHFCYLTTKMWRYAMGVLLVFVITFSVFPGEITSIKYEGTYSGLDFLSVRTSARQTCHPSPPPYGVPLTTCVSCTGLVVADRAGHGVQLL